jgi:hypothetical protein
MYEVHPPAVYIHERALATPQRRARVERMLACMHPPEAPEVVDDARLSEVSLSREWPRKGGLRTGQWKLTGDPIVILNAFAWESPEALAERARAFPGLRAWTLSGGEPWGFRERRHYIDRGTVCQDAWELHSALGCLHRCDYCHVGGFLNIMVNLEELVERLPELLDANPWLQLIKYDNQTDTIPFEPEYGASELLVDFFARSPDRYLMLYTKSDNVDHLLPLDHRGHTIVSFTISAATTARRIEHGTPDTLRRVEAAAKVAGAGYTPRVRFSPIVPVRDWRDEMSALARELLARVTPDLITMDLLGWVNPAALEDILDVSLLEPRFLEGIRSLYADGPPGPAYWPSCKQIIPHELRSEVYRFVIPEVRRHSTAVRLAICNETPEMWDELAPLLGMTAETHVCGCGPRSVPGNALFTAHRA